MTINVTDVNYKCMNSIFHANLGADPNFPKFLYYHMHVLAKLLLQ